MNVSRTFIERPIATSLLMVAVLLTGLLAYRGLAVSALPEVDYPTIEVHTGFPGASADVISSAVTAPLEHQLGQVPGLTEMQSTSSNGLSVITMQFDLSVKLDVAEEDVQSAINAASTYLPPDLPMPPTYSKINPADAPILTLALTSASIPLAQVEDYADTRLAQQLSQIPGVGLVSVQGGHKPAIRIDANPAALAANSLSLDDLRTSISNATLNRPKGSFSGPNQAYAVSANDQMPSSMDYPSLIVAYRNGAPVQLQQVAKVSDGYENSEQTAWKDTTPAVILNVQRQPGANIIAVADRILKLLPGLQTEIPGGVKLEVVSDRTIGIRASVEDVEQELLMTIGLVILVILLFLRKLSATIIPSIAVPLSLVGTFGVMSLLGYSLNNLTLMALTISTGFVVDDAIVMVENISRLIEEGKGPMEAAIEGARQIGFTVISLTISLIAVLIPLLFMGDIVGRLFREFAVTLAVTILISAFISLTLTPMMSARLLSAESEQRENALQRGIEAGFKAVIDLYARTLTVVLRHQTVTLAITAGTIALTAWLFILVPKGFFPEQDTGLLVAVTEAPAGISYPAMAAEQEQLAKVILADPAVEGLTSYVGVDDANEAIGMGRMLINLKPVGKRGALEDILGRLRQSAAKASALRLYLQPSQDLTVDTHVARSQYQLSLVDPNAAELHRYSDQLFADLQREGTLRDVATDQIQDSAAEALEIDRVQAGRFGVSVSAIDSALYNAFGQRQIATIYTQTNQYHVVLMGDEQFRSDPTMLSSIYVPGNGGSQVPIGSVVHLADSRTPTVLHHLGQFPSSTLSFEVKNGTALGDAVDRVQRALSKRKPPAGLQARLEGTARAFASSTQNELFLIVAALAAVYIVLGVLYESYIHPLTILSTLPSAGVGALLALMIFHAELTVIAIIGIILLIGIVKKNAIMMIDFALAAERHEGKTASDAIYQACLLRFRPILMTTMAALLGAVPLALGHGMGSELRRPLGITIIGGLLISQLLTLYTTPVVYLWFDRLAKRFVRAPKSETVSLGAAQ